MRRIAIVAAFSLITSLIFCASTIQAQIIYGDPLRGEARLIYQSWKLTYTENPAEPETTLTQSAFPVYLFVPVAENWEVHVNTGFSRSHIDGGGSDASVSALESPLIRIYRSFSEDRVFVAGGLMLPGGKTKLDTTELPISELIADDYLTLPVKQLGNGVGVLLQLGGAEQYENILFGGSIAYFVRGSYTYVDGGSDYNPGDEFTIQGSAALPVDDGRIDVDLGYKYYVADQLGSKDIFKNGDQFSLALSGSYDFGTTRGGLQFLYLLRGKDSRLKGQAFNYEENNSNGNKSVISGFVNQRITETISGNFTAGFRVVGANDWAEDHPSFFGQSNLFNIGAGVSYSSPDDRYSISGRIILYDGSADDDAIDVSGSEISVAGRVRL
jgi:hypothetical protein